MSATNILLSVAVCGLVFLVLRLRLALKDMMRWRDVWSKRALIWEDRHGTSAFLLNQALVRLERYEGREEVNRWLLDQRSLDEARKKAGYI